MASTTETIESRIVELLVARVPAGVEVSQQTNIARELGLDSAAIMDLVLDLEDKLGISMPLDETAEIETVADLCRAVEALATRAG